MVIKTKGHARGKPPGDGFRGLDHQWETIPLDQVVRAPGLWKINSDWGWYVENWQTRKRVGPYTLATIYRVYYWLNRTLENEQDHGYDRGPPPPALAKAKAIVEARETAMSAAQTAARRARYLKALESSGADVMHRCYSSCKDAAEKGSE